MNILVLNAGSNSLKFDIIATDSASTHERISWGNSLVSGSYDDIGKSKASFKTSIGGQSSLEQPVKARDHGEAAQSLFRWIGQGHAKGTPVRSLDDVARVGHRVVHGADRFNGPVEINDEVVGQIDALSDLAPLHNRSVLGVIKASREAFGSAVPMIAVFDTVFHQTIPDEAALYPLPLALSERYRIRRYGFHGISHRYLMLRYSQLAKRSVDELKLITLHLEGGSSAAAILHGKSIDTSMGFTPLEGLMMGTRCGDIDPSIVTYLMRKERLGIEEVEKLLNEQSGLLGVSQLSADTRQLIPSLGQPAVRLAVEMFALRVRKYIGSYLAELGGADAVLFGGGIGENMPYIRQRIAHGLDWCGAELDVDCNDRTVDYEGAISSSDSKIQIWVIPSRENLMIAYDVANFV